jgi:hypothetical protein
MPGNPSSEWQARVEWGDTDESFSGPGGSFQIMQSNQGASTFVFTTEVHHYLRLGTFSPKLVISHTNGDFGTATKNDFLITPP